MSTPVHTETWTLRSLPDVAWFQEGPGVRTHQFTTSGVKLLNGTNIDNGRLLLESTNRHISTTEAYGGYRHFLVDAGDILLATSGITIDRLHEKVAFAPAESLPLCMNTSTVRFKPRAGIVDSYLYFFLQSDLFKQQIGAQATGSAQLNFGPSHLSKVTLPVPSLPEQRAIAAALSDVDALIAALDQLIAKKRDLKTATMQQLLTGQRRLPGFTGPWDEKRLGDVADVDPDQLGTETKPDYVFRYVSLEDVDHGVLRSHCEHVFRTAPSRARRRVRIDDILVSTVRPNLKAHLWFRELGSDWICSTGFAVVRCRMGQSTPAFIYQHMFGAIVGRQIETLITGSNYPAISSRDVRNLIVPMPMIEEQLAIGEVLRDMDDELAALEARREKTKLIKQGMMQELLTGRTRLVAAAT